MVERREMTVALGKRCFRSFGAYIRSGFPPSNHHGVLLSSLLTGGETLWQVAVHGRRLDRFPT